MSPKTAPSPVFVYGALRSGTTLLRLMLSGHPALHSTGEADFLFDYIAPAPGGGWRYDRAALAGDRIFRAKGLTLPEGLDGADLAEHLLAEMAARAPGRLCLSLHRAAPKIVALFPRAKIIHLIRDPRDVARSSIRMGWAGNSYFGVDHWIGTEQDWEAAGLDEPEALTLAYESLMADLEGELTRICGFLGLEFDPAMLRYHENSTYYGPPDPGIAQKWKTKASPREIALIEARVGGLLAERGYVPAGPAATPGALELVLLMAGNRMKRWRHNIKRYGLGLFAGHHAARALGLRAIAGKLARRQEAVRIAGPE